MPPWGRSSDSLSTKSHHCRIILSKNVKKSKKWTETCWSGFCKISCISIDKAYRLQGSNEDAYSNFNQLLLLRNSDSPEIGCVYRWIYVSCYTKWMCSNHDTLNYPSSEPDKSNKEQFTICIRWAGEDLQDHEDFIGIYQVDGINANSLVHVIRDTLLGMRLSLSQCHGQCASNMSGSRGWGSCSVACRRKTSYIHTLLCTCFTSCSLQNHKGI